MKTTPPPEDNYFYLNTMTGTNSSNNRLILRQNMEINFNFLRRIFGNEILEYVEWKRHCAIINKNVLSSEIFHIPPVI